MKNNYFIQEWDYTQLGPLPFEADQLAIMRTAEFVNIYGVPMVQMGDYKIEGLIKITYNNKCIYRKYVGNNDIPEDQCVVLTNRSLAELGIHSKKDFQTPILATIEPASSISYLWHNSYAFIRKPFQWAVSGLLLTILFGIASVVLGFIALI